MTIVLAANAMVLLVGPSGSGKSTFAARHLRPTQVLSSDELRARVMDDPNDQSATDAAFELLHAILALRLARGRLSVVDATNVEAWARAPLLAAARRNRRPAVAIVFALPLEELLQRATERMDRRVPPAALRRQQRWLARSMTELPNEGLHAIWTLDSVAAVDGAAVTIQPG
ncbi:MAG: AAA family ATPase [Candidatus Limnocylindria bacterium]